MGSQFCFSSKHNHNQSKMRILLLVALAVATTVLAEPEAEANADALYYGYYGYGGYGYPYRHYGYPYRFGHYLGGRYLIKRDAEAEPTAEADPAVLYHGVYGLGHKLGLGHLGYYGHPYGSIPVLAKPEAETEAVVAPKVVKVVPGRVLNAPYGVPYRYGPTVPGVGPPADAFGRRYWW